MVHRKSEYRLQFHFVGNDLRKKIWLDNVKFRESCRLSNQSHHYWTYQVTEDPCECDTVVPEEEEDAPLPPHRLKHKFLVSMYGSPEKHTATTDAAAAVPPITGQDQPLALAADATQQRGDFVLDRAADISELEVPGEIRDEASTKPLEQSPHSAPCCPVPDPTLPTRSRSPTSNPQFRPFQPVGPSPSVPGAATRGVRRTSPGVTGLQPGPVRVSFPTPAVDYVAEHETPRRDEAPPRRSETSTSALPSPSCLAHPSRTTRTLFVDGNKQCPFAAFGWNDTNKDVGDKKTYNVSAPQAQVYENALRALKKRREEVEKFLAKEAALRGHLRACDYGVNHGSIWMSEYREKFGGGSQRPATVVPAQHLRSWRCYS